MIEKSLILYQELLADLRRCSELGLPEMEIIESCFKISMNYWVKLKSWLMHYSFPDSPKEVEFFKRIKPGFTSHISYYTHCYKALLFLPAGDKNEQGLYWERELKKIDQFRAANRGFCEYFLKGEEHKDILYFVRANSDLSNLSEAKTYDVDIEVATSHDLLVTEMLALEKYREFIGKKKGGL
jgi:hypothetical protein